MKKVLVLIGAVMVLGLVSCNKEKDCECVTKVDGVEAGTTEVTTKDKCGDMDESSTIMGIETTVTCTEK